MIAESAVGSSATRWLQDWREGDELARERLFAFLYDDLRERARRQLARERPGHTLQPTALVHEAYLRLLDHRRIDWQNRAHFLAVAALTMRRILVSHARRRRSAKRGGGAVAVTLEVDLAGGAARSEPILALEEALAELEALEGRQGRVVELRYFGGLTIEEAAEVLGVSPATVKLDWALAKAWLFRRLRAGAPKPRP